jgi:hypothetical protein
MHIIFPVIKPRRSPSCTAAIVNIHSFLMGSLQKVTWFQVEIVEVFTTNAACVQFASLKKTHTPCIELSLKVTLKLSLLLELMGNTYYNVFIIIENNKSYPKIFIFFVFLVEQ